MSTRLNVRYSPAAVATIYVCVSAVWIFASDRAIDIVVDDPALATRIQTGKGLFFVAGSGVLIYVLVRRGQRSLARTNDRLDRTLQQTTILLRLLRHNLRNSCNVIGGNVELLRDRLGEEAEPPLETINVTTDALVTVSEKTGVLRDLLFEESVEHHEVDVAALAETVVERVRNEFPEATIRTDTPERALAEADPRLETALYELLENAIVHDDGEARIDLRVTDGSGQTTVEVADTGPGLPPVERAVLEREFETPMVHSDGLGLWIARTIVRRVGGEFEVEHDAPEFQGSSVDAPGTVVTMVLPS